MLWRAFDYFLNVCGTVVLWKGLLGIWDASAWSLEFFFFSAGMEPGVRKLPGTENSDENSTRPLRSISKFLGQRTVRRGARNPKRGMLLSTFSLLKERMIWQGFYHSRYTDVIEGDWKLILINSA